MPQTETLYDYYPGTNTGQLIASHHPGPTFSIPGTPDGMGILQGGKFSGDLISNNNDGTVDLIDPTTGTVTMIASGGPRGDFTGQDLLNGTLFLSQTDSILRLSCGTGCSFGGGGGGGGGGTGVPEPASLGLWVSDSSECSGPGALAGVASTDRRGRTGARVAARPRGPRRIPTPCPSGAYILAIPRGLALGIP